MSSLPVPVSPVIKTSSSDLGHARQYLLQCRGSTYNLLEHGGTEAFRIPQGTWRAWNLRRVHPLPHSAQAEIRQLRTVLRCRTSAQQQAMPVGRTSISSRVLL